MSEREIYVGEAYRDIATIEREIAGLRRSGMLDPLTRASLISEKRLEIEQLMAAQRGAK